MTLREATTADHARILEMAVRFIETTSYQHFVKADAAALTFLLDDLTLHGTILLAEVEGNVVGMLAWEVTEHILLGPHVEEVAWWVEPEYRHRSIGPRLVHYMEDWCGTRALSVVKMLAPADAKTGQFYARLGYRPVETAWLKVLPHEPVQQSSEKQFRHATDAPAHRS